MTSQTLGKQGKADTIGKYAELCKHYGSTISAEVIANALIYMDDKTTADEMITLDKAIKIVFAEMRRNRKTKVYPSKYSLELLQDTADQFIDPASRRERNDTETETSREVKRIDLINKYGLATNANLDSIEDTLKAIQLYAHNKDPARAEQRKGKSRQEINRLIIADRNLMEDNTDDLETPATRIYARAEQYKSFIETLNDSDLAIVNNIMRNYQPDQPFYKTVSKRQYNKCNQFVSKYGLRINDFFEGMERLKMDYEAIQN